MHDLMSVAVLDSTNYLLEEFACTVFWQFAMNTEKVEQFSSRVLEDHDNLVRRGTDGVSAGRVTGR